MNNARRSWPPASVNPGLFKFLCCLLTCTILQTHGLLFWFQWYTAKLWLLYECKYTCIFLLMWSRLFFSSNCRHHIKQFCLSLFSIWFIANSKRALEEMPSSKMIIYRILKHPTTYNLEGKRQHAACRHFRIMSFGLLQWMPVPSDIYILVDQYTIHYTSSYAPPP